MTRRDWQRLSIVYVRWQAWGLGLMLWVCCAGAAAQELTPWTNGPTPLLALTDQRGIDHTLTAYRGRVVLVNFWATWCEPCREEMPSLQALQNKIGPERFVVLAVNYGESPEKVQQFAHALAVDFPMLLDRHTEAAKGLRSPYRPLVAPQHDSGVLQRPCAPGRRCVCLAQTPLGWPTP